MRTNQRTRGVLLWLAFSTSACSGDGAPAKSSSDMERASERDQGSVELTDPPASDGSPAPAAGNEGRPSGVGHCYSEISSAHPATSNFWTVFRAGDLEGRAEATAQLSMAAEELPEEEELALLTGLAFLWRLTEPLPEQVEDSAGRIEAALAARAHFERALALCPTDHRIAGWLGPLLVRQGEALADQELVDQGRAVIAEGIEHYPSFVNFAEMLVFATLPQDDPEYPRAIAAALTMIEACGPQDGACRNQPRAAHNLEGTWVHMGDLYAKAGDLAEARKAYAKVRDVAEYDSWDYKSLLDERLAGLESRVAAYENDDPTDDPEAIWASDLRCRICHQD